MSAAATDVLRAGGSSDGFASSAGSGPGVERPQLLTTGVASRNVLPQAGDSLSIEVQFKNPRRRFPLADEFLPEVSITPEEIDLLKRQCRIEMNRVLRKSQAIWAQSEDMFEGGCGEWRSHVTKPNLAFFRRKRESNNSSARQFIARGQVASVTLKDLEYGLYCDTTTDERAVKTDLYRDLFLDAAVLRVFERQTQEDPFRFFGIKWLAYVSPADKFISSRDYAFAEYARRVETTSGERILVRVLLPVNSQIVSIMNEREYDLVRGEMTCTYMYRADASGRSVQVFAEGSLDPSGNAAGWIGKSFLTHFAPTIINLEHCADVKHLMMHGNVLSPDAFQAKVAETKRASHKNCVACLKTFGSSLVKRTHLNCRSCGQLMCSRCVMTLTLCLPWHEKRDAEHPSAVINEKFCFKCVCLVRAHRNENVRGSSLLETPSSRHDSETAILQATTSKMEQLNVVDEYPAESFAGSRFVEERIRSLKEQYILQDKRRNLRMANPLDDDVVVPGPSATATGAAPPPPVQAFDDMERSLQHQQALLRNMQFEARRQQQLRAQVAYYQQQQQQMQQQAHPQLQYSGYSGSTSSAGSLKHPRVTDESFSTSRTMDLDDDEDVYEFGHSRNDAHRLQYAGLI